MTKRARAPKLPPIKVAFVTWFDHYSVTGWHEGSELENPGKTNKGLGCVSVGILAHEDEGMVKLSTAWAPDNGYGDLMCILRPNIETMFTVPLSEFVKQLRDGTKNAIMQDAGHTPTTKESKMKYKKPKPKKPKC